MQNNIINFRQQVRVDEISAKKIPDHNLFVKVFFYFSSHTLCQYIEKLRSWLTFHVPQSFSRTKYFL